MEVGNVTFGVRFDETSIEQALQKLRSKFSDQKDFIITVKTNEDALYGLNKHLDKKKAHLKEVKQYYKDNPIVVSYKEDDETTTQRGTKNTHANRDKDTGNQSNRDASYLTDSLDISGQIKTRMDKVKQKVEDGLSGIFEEGTWISEPIKLATSGFFSGIGHTIAEKMTKSFLPKLEKDFNFSVDKAGEKTAGFTKSVFDFIVKPPETPKATPINLQAKPLSIPLKPLQIPDKVSIGQRASQSIKSIQTAIPDLRKIQTTTKKLVEGAIGDIVSEALDQLKQQLSKQGLDTSDLTQTKAEFAKIKDGFKSAYKQLNVHLSKGELDEARSLAQQILTASTSAKKDIDSIKLSAKSNNIPAVFGSELSTYAGNAKGVIQARYVKPTERILAKLDNPNSPIVAPVAKKQLQETLSVGRDTVSGLKQGLSGTSVDREAALLGLNIIANLERVLEIHSPSRRTWRIGHNTIAGLIGGMNEASQALTPALSEIGNEIENRLTASIPFLTKKGLPQLPYPKKSQPDIITQTPQLKPQYIPGLSPQVVPPKPKPSFQVITQAPQLKPVQKATPAIITQAPKLTPQFVPGSSPQLIPPPPKPTFQVITQQASPTPQFKPIQATPAIITQAPKLTPQFVPGLSPNTSNTPMKTVPKYIWESPTFAPEEIPGLSPKKAKNIGVAFVENIVGGIKQAGQGIDAAVENVSNRLEKKFAAKPVHLPQVSRTAPPPKYYTEKEKAEYERNRLPPLVLSHEEYAKAEARINRLNQLPVKGNIKLQKELLAGGFVPQNLQEARQFNTGSRQFFNAGFNWFGSQFENKVGGAFAGHNPDPVAAKKEAKGITREIAGAVFSAGAMANPGAMGAAALSPLVIPSIPLMGTGMLVQNMLSPLIGSIRDSLMKIDPIIGRYTALTGSREGGQKEFKYVQDVSTQYSVGTESASQQYSQLAVAAKGTKLEGDGVKDLFEAISASSRALNLSMFDTELVFNAYTQILAKGKLSMEELRQQLSEKFPPAMGIFAQALGVSVPEMTTLIGKGAVLSEDILPKVAVALKQNFGAAAREAGDSFTGSITRLENAKFNLGAALTTGLGGAFSAYNNFAAFIIEKFAGSFKTIQQMATTLLIGMTAQVAVALELIFNMPAVTKVTGKVQNFFMTSFSKGIYAVTPFLAGLFIDLIDDALGSKRNVLQNMSQGVGNLFVGIAGDMDTKSRMTEGKSKFTPEFEEENPKQGGFFKDVQEKLDSIKILGISFGEVTESIGDFFKKISGGAGEFIALIVMFEQLAVLLNMLVMPTVKRLGATVFEMGAGVAKAFSSMENITLSFNNFLAVTLKQSSALIGATLAKLAFFTAEAAAVVGIMMLSQSDFGDPLSTEMGKNSKKIIDDVGGIKKSLDELKMVGVDTAKDIGKAFNSMDLSTAIPSKGLELNLKKVFGLEDETKSYKTDDLFKDLNRKPKDDDNLLVKFVRLFPEDRERDGTNKEAREMKAQAEKEGVGKFFSDEGYVTLGQKQLYNKAFDNNKFTRQLQGQLRGLNLTPETVPNFASGQIGSQIQKIQQYDKVLEQLGKKRVKAALIDTTDSKQEVRSIDQDIKKVLADRKLLQKPLGQAFDFLYDARKQIENRMDSVTKSDMPFEGKQALLAPLEEQKKAIDQTVEYIKNSGLSKVAAPLEEIWTGVISKVRDADSLFEKLTNRQKIEDLGKQSDIYSRNLSPEGTKTALDVTNLDSLGTTERALEAVLETRKKALERILSISEIETNETRSKEVSDLRKSIESDSLNLAQTKQQIAQAQNEMYNKLKEQSKAVRDYFQSVSDSAKEKELEYKKLKNTLKADIQQSKLRSILNDGFDTIMTQYIEAISSIMEKETERANKKYDLEAGIFKSNQEKRNVLKQGDDILRQLPSDQSVAVVLDTSSLRSDLNVKALNENLNESVDIQGKFSTKLNSTKLAFGDNVLSADELLGKLQQISPLLDVSKDKIDQNTVAIKGWDSGLRGLLETTGSLQSNLSAVGGQINKNVASTAEWVANLSTGAGLLKTAIDHKDEVGKTITSVGTNDPQNNPNVFGMLGNLMQGKGVYGGGGLNRPQVNIAPLQAVESISGRKVTTGRTTADIEVHHPSRGNTRESSSRDYQMIDGKLEEVDRGKGGIPLIKKDMVMSRNGNKNVELPAFASGYVSNVGEGVGRVRIKDAEGNMLGELLHMTGIKVKNGQFVQYGQPLGTQGGVGKKGDNTYAQHLHGSMSKPMWTNYIRDFNDGGFDTDSVNCQMCGATNHNAGQHKQLANDKFINAVNSGKGGSGWIGESTPKSAATLERTGTKNKNGLENLTLTVAGEQFTVHSGKPSTQGMFGAGGTTKEGSKAPLEYGSYNIESARPGMSAGVGKTFLPLSPNFKTNRKDLGIHNDADIDVAPGSAGCLVFDTPEQLARFQALIGKGGIDKLNFKSPSDKRQQQMTVQPQAQKPKSYTVSSTETGEASFYREPKYDKYNTDPRTRNGEWYDENKDTAAIDSKRMDKLNTIAKVTNLKTGQQRFVRITDTGVFGSSKFNRRILDLSKGAAERVGITAAQGVGKIRTEFLPGKVPMGKEGDAIVAQLNAQLSGSKSSGVLGISENYDEDGKPLKPSLKPTKGKPSQYKFSTKLNSDVKVRKPSELAATVTESQQMATRSNAQDEERQRQQAALDDKKAQDEIIRTRNKAVNSLTDYSRELGLNYKATSRTVKDQEFSAIAYPTQEQRKDKEIADTRKTFGDNRDNILKNIRDLQKPIGEAKKLLSTVDLPENLKAPAQKALNDMIDKENKYKLLLNRNNELEIANMDAIEKRFNYEQEQKSQKEKIEERQSSLQVLQQRIQLLEKQKEINPYAKELDALPELREQAALQEASIEYAQKIAELNSTVHDDTRSKESYKAQLDLYAKEHIAKAESIRLTRVQEERELSLLKIKRNFEKDSRFLNLDNTLKKSQTRRPDVQYEVAESEAYNSLQGAYINIGETKYDNPIDALRERSKNAQIYLQSRDQAELNQRTSKTSLEKESFDFFTQPEIDSANRRAEKMRDRGYTFEANRVSRDAGHAAEDFRYRQQLLDIENQITERRSAGEKIAESEVDKLKDSLEEIHNFNLDDVDKQFKTFGETIDDVAKQAVGGLGDAIADLVIEGGDPLEKLSNIFNQILKGFISTGINSLVSPLMGNLFGGMGKQQTAQSGLGLGSLFGGQQGLGGLFGSGGLGSIFSSIGSIFGLKKGGMVQNFATGGDVRNSDNPIGLALRKEGSNSVLAALTPNERVLTVREAMAYNTLFPNGILESIKPSNFNDGGMVESSPVSQMIKQDSSINVGVTANIEDSGGGNMKEKQLVALIRSVVTAELNRQKSPGGILAT